MRSYDSCELLGLKHRSYLLVQFPFASVLRTRDEADRVECAYLLAGGTRWYRQPVLACNVVELCVYSRVVMCTRRNRPPSYHCTPAAELFTHTHGTKHTHTRTHKGQHVQNMLSSPTIRSEIYIYNMHQHISYLGWQHSKQNQVRKAANTRDKMNHRGTSMITPVHARHEFQAIDTTTGRTQYQSASGNQTCRNETLDQITRTIMSRLVYHMPSRSM